MEQTPLSRQARHLPLKKGEAFGNLGFTLVELIVSLVVIMLLAGIGTVSISNFSNSKKVESVTSELIDQIKLARNMAITNQLPPGGGSGLKYVGVTTVTNGTVTASLNNSGTNYFSKKVDSGGSGTSVDNRTFGFAVNTGRLTEYNGAFINGPVNIGVSGVVIKTITINDLGVVNGN